MILKVRQNIVGPLEEYSKYSLNVFWISFYILEQEISIHVSATCERILIAAELMELKKVYYDGSLREISMADIEHFQNSGETKSAFFLPEIKIAKDFHLRMGPIEGLSLN